MSAREPMLEWKNRLSRSVYRPCNASIYQRMNLYIIAWDYQ
jgi:hypothetical protein